MGRQRGHATQRTQRHDRLAQDAQQFGQRVVIGARLAEVRAVELCQVIWQQIVIADAQDGGHHLASIQRILPLGRDIV